MQRNGSWLCYPCSMWINITKITACHPCSWNCALQLGNRCRPLRLPVISQPMHPKTKILTTENLNEPIFLDIGDDMIEVLRGRQNHNFWFRQEIIWWPPEKGHGGFTTSKSDRLEFNEHRDTLLNRHLSLRRRLKLFDSVITPTVLLAFWLVLWPRINFRT